MASGKNSDLYRWKRWSSGESAVSKQWNSTTAKQSKTKVAATDNIQDWIKKVEKASDAAAVLTFGHNNSRHGDYPVTNGGGALATLEAVREHDEAHTEAQDLLNEWMAQKCWLDDSDETLDGLNEDYDMKEYVASKQAAKTDLRDQWDNMLAENSPVVLDLHTKISSEEIFDEIESRDEREIVDNLLSNLMEKDLIGETKLKRDLSIGKKRIIDPTETMAARQQKVKENREKRQQQRELQLRQKQQHKEAQSQARQLVMKEERNKDVARQREEALLQQEMAKLRKEMQEQRRLEEEAKRREWLYEEQKKEELRRQELTRKQQERELKHEAEALVDEERRQMRQRLDDVHVIKTGRDLQCLQRHFRGWYQLIMIKRLIVGKAKAIADWRVMLRAWNAWSAYVRASRAERDTQLTKEHFQYMHRKTRLAEEHHRHRLLKKCLSAWCLFIHHEQLGQELTQQQAQTKTKMAAFLEAAASGKLWTAKGEERSADGVKRAKGRSDISSDRGDSVRQNVDDVVAGASRPRVASVPSNRPVTTPGNQTKHRGKPKHAWQVTRKHVNLPIEELLAMGDGCVDNHHTQDGNNHTQSKSDHTQSKSDRTQSKSDRNRDESDHARDESDHARDESDHARDESDHTQANRNQNNATEISDSRKRNIKYRSNKFEYRYAAQQHALQEQQLQLREQQRLIEDLQTAQRQQILRMKLGGGEQDGGGDSQLTTERSQLSAETVTSRSEPSDSNSARSETELTKTARPPLLNGMQEREAARLRLKMDREERHRQKEEDKLAAIKAKEEAQRREEEAEKRARIEKRRQEKQLVKQKEAEKQQRVEFLREQTRRADELYRRSLVNHYGLKPWQQLMRTAGLNMQVAEDHHNTLLLVKCLLPWRHYTAEVLRERAASAEHQWEVILTRRAFNRWKRYGHLQSIQLQQARRHFGRIMKRRTLQAWQRYLTDERLRNWNNEESAARHDKIRVMKTCFLEWRQYPQTLKMQRLREKRLADMRKKVCTILPDFGG